MTLSAERRVKMYQSPISLIQKDVESKIDDAVIMTVQKVGVEVDKEELLCALKYDRKQYEKGYRDGLSYVVKRGKWVECKSSEHWKCSECGCRASFWFNEENSSSYSLDMSEWLSSYCPNCGTMMDKGDKDE